MSKAKLIIDAIEKLSYIARVAQVEAEEQDRIDIQAEEALEVGEQAMAALLSGELRVFDQEPKQPLQVLNFTGVIPDRQLRLFRKKWAEMMVSAGHDPSTVVITNSKGIEGFTVDAQGELHKVDDTVEIQDDDSLPDHKDLAYVAALERVVVEARKLIATETTLDEARCRRGMRAAVEQLDAVDLGHNADDGSQTEAQRRYTEALGRGLSDAEAREEGWPGCLRVEAQQQSQLLTENQHLLLAENRRLRATRPMDYVPPRVESYKDMTREQLVDLVTKLIDSQLSESTALVHRALFDHVVEHERALFDETCQLLARLSEKDQVLQDMEQACSDMYELMRAKRPSYVIGIDTAKGGDRTAVVVLRRDGKGGCTVLHNEAIDAGQEVALDLDVIEHKSVAETVRHGMRPSVVVGKNALSQLVGEAKLNFTGGQLRKIAENETLNPES